MDNQAKLHVQDKKNENALLASRDEMFKMMMKNANAIDVSPVPDDDDTSSHRSENPKK